MNAQVQLTAVAQPADDQDLVRSPTSYSQLKTFYNRKYEAAWFSMNGRPRPCFTPTLLQEINNWFDEARAYMDHQSDLKYLVLSSNVEGTFNLGGDLNLFRQLIVARDREGLFQYAKACIDVLYANMVGLDRDLTTIALVQGDALGGGFEAALSSHVLIAERGTKMGLPEILFNLFPGMGAYSILSRKIGPAQAERMILGGKLYSAEELHDMGVVDVLADDGQGEMAVYEYIKRENRARNGYRAVRAVKQHIDRVSYEELIEVTEMWVDAALRLESRDLRMMERLVSRQTQKAQAVA